MDSLSICLSCKVAVSSTTSPPVNRGRHRIAVNYRHCITREGSYSAWVLGFEQCSSHHGARALQGNGFSAFQTPPAFRTCCGPPVFRWVVSAVAQVHSLSNLLSLTGIQQSALR